MKTLTPFFGLCVFSVLTAWFALGQATNTTEVTGCLYGRSAVRFTTNDSGLYRTGPLVPGNCYLLIVKRKASRVPGAQLWGQVLPQTGGIQETKELSSGGERRRLASIAEAYHVAIHSHRDGVAVANAPTIHLAATVPNFFIRNVPLPRGPKDREMCSAIVSASLETRCDRFLQVPADARLGIQASESTLEKYHAA